MTGLMLVLLSLAPGEQPSNVSLIENGALQLPEASMLRFVQLHERLRVLETSRPSLVGPTLAGLFGLAGQATAISIAVLGSTLIAAAVAVIAAIPLLVGIITFGAACERLLIIERELKSVRTEPIVLRFLPL